MLTRRVGWLLPGQPSPPISNFFETEAIDTLILLQATFKSALEGSFFSPYNVAPERQYVLFYVRRLP